MIARTRVVQAPNRSKGPNGISLDKTRLGQRGESPCWTEEPPLRAIHGSRPWEFRAVPALHDLHRLSRCEGIDILLLERVFSTKTIPLTFDAAPRRQVESVMNLVRTRNTSLGADYSEYILANFVVDLRHIWEGFEAIELFESDTSESSISTYIYVEVEQARQVVRPQLHWLLCTLSEQPALAHLFGKSDEQNHDETEITNHLTIVCKDKIAVEVRKHVEE